MRKRWMVNACLLESLQLRDRGAPAHRAGVWAAPDFVSKCVFVTRRDSGHAARLLRRLEAPEPSNLVLSDFCRRKLPGLSVKFAATECDELQAQQPPPVILPGHLVNVSYDGDTILRQQAGQAILFNSP